MTIFKRFGAKSTSTEVLEGLDLTGRNFLVTGCATGIGFETLRALVARGGHVVGTARSIHRARQACEQAGRSTTPIACDQDDFESVTTAIRDIRALGLSFDAIIANAGIMVPQQPDLRYGIESQFRVNHLSHMLLITGIADLLRDGSGRLVIVSSSAAQDFAPREGVAFDNIDARKGYNPWRFYGQSKLANLCFAKTMAERLADRGVTSNALHPGVITATDLARSLPLWGRIALPIASWFAKSIPQGAATQCYLAAHPDLTGTTGAFFANCRLAKPNPHANSADFRAQLWSLSEQLLNQHAPKAN